MQQVKNFFREIGGHEIINWRGAFSPLFTLFPWNVKKYYKGVHKTTPVSPILLLSKGRETEYLFNNDYYESYAAEIFERYINNAKEIEQINEKTDVVVKKIETKYKQLAVSNLAGLSDSQLRSSIDGVNKLLGELVARTVYIEKFDESTIHRVLKDESAQVIDRIWEKATDPHFENFEMRRLKILLETAEGNIEIAAKMVQFIFTDYFEVKDDLFIKKKIAEVLNDKKKLKAEVENYTKKLQKNQRDFELWLNKLTTREKSIARYVQMVMRMRDWRKDPIAQAQAIFSNIAKELFLRAGIDTSCVYCVAPHELVRGLDWLKKNKSNIIKRTKGSLLGFDTKGKYQVAVVDHSKVKKEIDSYLKKHEEVSELKGQIGAKGFARGRVKVIMDATKGGNFRDGDVLVTGMTRPEFVPLMKKAAAIITDEGGITCHAAIVSRELKKPCIIGTKNASIVLRDGDLVEVDANSGVVKILERKKINVVKFVRPHEFYNN